MSEYVRGVSGTFSGHHAVVRFEKLDTEAAEVILNLNNCHNDGDIRYKQADGTGLDA